jgi:hypothetical protein
MRLALKEHLRRKARLRRKRVRPVPAQTPPAEPQLSVETQYRTSFQLLGKDGLHYVRKWKARGHCTYDEVTPLLPPIRSLSANEVEDLVAMLSSLMIELRDAPHPTKHADLVLDRKRILLFHHDPSTRLRIARALEHEGAAVLAPRMNTAGVPHCALESALDGAVLNFVIDYVPILQLANRLHARNIPIVFYTAFGTRLVARATAQMHCAIISSPGRTEAIAPALAALIGGRRLRRLRSFLDNKSDKQPFLSASAGCFCAKRLGFFRA